LKPSDSLIFDFCLKETNVEGFEPYRGKVRDVYTLNKDTLAIVVTDRISAFDHILKEPIPFKGQILNRLAAFSLEKVSDIIPTHLISVPHPNVTIAKRCTPLPIEVVVRGYLAGHAWRTYKSGERMLCGAEMPDGLRQNEAFPEPILTPTTKATEGHDEDISPVEIVKKKFLTQELWDLISETALKLFKRGSEIAQKRGLILVDTKYEFGLFDGELILIDEIHTADSSRYFYSDGYQEKMESGEQPKQLSKEFVREWLIEQDFMGKPGQKMPTLTDSFRMDVYNRYADLFEVLTGDTFTPVYTPDFNITIKRIFEQFSK
jgi:phosphoribosylaminoimidazole-succinocarboxamide synthase